MSASAAASRKPGWIRQIVAVLLGMNGIVPGHMSAARWSVILGSYAFYYLVLAPRASVAWSVGYFVAATLLHYVYLFGMFRTSGWSRGLRQRAGDEPAYRVHTGWMAFAFCHNALSIGYICVATRGLPLLGVAVPAALPWFNTALAFGLVAFGLGIKIWATLCVGLDAYYYRDLFLERREGAMSAVGPYRWFRNPMYTVGHLQAYGLALFTASAWGLVAVALNQALVLAFNAAIEQPHVGRMHADAKRLT
jgi:protein-S-isoprenylcysteine O-methyltransferase Ste14